MKTLTIILACTTFCYQPHFKLNECSIDKADKQLYTYHKIVSVGETDYTFQIANKPYDLNSNLYSSGDIEVFDKQNIKIECPDWFK